MRYGRVGRWSVLLSVLAWSGCSNAINTIEGSTDRRLASGPPATERVHFGSKALARDLVFGEVVTRRQGLILHAQVSLENRARRTVNFEYRWEWTDADGFELGDTLSNWQPAVVYAQERKLMNGVGPGPAAANFRLYVREAGS